MSENSVADYWDRFVGTHLNSPDHWEANQVVQQAQWKSSTGDAFKNPVDWFMERFGPFEKMASICSGSGILEQHIASNYLQGGTGQIEGYDLSPGSISLAKEKTAGLRGVQFHISDANSQLWDLSYLDAVFAHGALHHIENLDHCLGQLRRALKQSGYLYVNDYIGPRRFQWTDVQLRLAQELLEILPPNFRRKHQVSRCDPVALKNLDPSEAVRSDHIIDHINAHFEIIVRCERGGTLLAPIFGSGCVSPAVFETEEGMRIIESLCSREKYLIDRGVIPSDHVLIVAKPRPEQF
ncbi:class I SAM-dependent methyltransferase [Variovorax humicola]|uniref:Class I SAM-dependent methyltransferase n=1 Tax=Variovorax humicola TaxID=1769758 RepID=A0ABU8W289_9BURK